MMFADDTLIISKTPRGLQNLLDHFGDFCKQRGLIINTDKTKLMMFNPHKKISGRFLLDSVPLERVASFEYLGFTITDQMFWGKQLDKCTLKLKQYGAAILKMQKLTQDQEVLPALDIFKAKALGAALYGVELWGHVNHTNLQVAENNFFRALVGLPQSTPLLPVLKNLGMRSISSRIRIRPLLYWRRVWCTPELAHYKDALQEVITMDGNHKIPWLIFVKKTTWDSGPDRDVERSCIDRCRLKACH